jgi:hypothetical protein
MSDLPPGVRVADIPGAAPSETEAAAEEFFERVADPIDGKIRSTKGLGRHWLLVALGA